MRKVLKITACIALGIVGICGASFLLDRTSYSKWNVVNNVKGDSKISWATFEWGSAVLSGKYFEKAFMNIPCKIDGIPNVFTFQFDLGADVSGIYENTFNSLPALKENTNQKIKRLKSPLQFWNKNKYFDNLTIRFGDYTATNKTGFVYRNYGNLLEKIERQDTIHAGTIGSDLFRNKVLIIDYPNNRFAICDEVSGQYNMNLIDIQLDTNGRVILPMIFKEHSYRIMFDNGSSIFPLITEAKNVSRFSTLPDIDTIAISSWGKTHDVTGKMITDTFEIGGQKFSNVKVYANHSGLGIDKNTDGMTGNALFWDKVITIDFKNKKFGVK